MIFFTFKTLSLFFIFSQFTSCSKNFNQKDIFVNQPNNIVKIDGEYAAYISPKKMNLKKKFSSEDCDSWAVEINLDKAYKESLSKVLNSMFKELTFTNKVLTTEEIESANYIAQIVILHEDANSTFVNEENTGVFKIFFESIIKVYGNNKKNIVNEVSSNSEWKKNIYVKCKLQDGALKASQKSLEELIELIHSKVYESVYKITRY